MSTPDDYYREKREMQQRALALLRDYEEILALLTEAEEAASAAVAATDNGDAERVVQRIEEARELLGKKISTAREQFERASYVGD